MTNNFTADSVEPFAEYLRSNGAEVLERTNPWELLRYKMAECGTIVVYQNSQGRISLPDIAATHFQRFKVGKAIETVTRAGAEAKHTLRRQIVERDGECCCYCGQFLNAGGALDQTMEHFLSIYHGGNNHVANLGLAHELCNRLAGNLSVMGKIRLRGLLRARLAEAEPWNFVSPQRLFDEFQGVAA